MLNNVSRTLMARIAASAAALAVVAGITGAGISGASAAPLSATSVSTVSVVATPAPAAAAPISKRKAPHVSRAERMKARVASERASLVRLAKRQVGKSYVAGAAGPSAFDCSGLTQWLYRKVTGKNLAHYSYDQYRVSHKVHASKAEPGDLVFYFQGGTHHVGIYIGRGLMVHAANPETDVKISPILGTSWTNDNFTAVGRILPA